MKFMKNCITVADIVKLEIISMAFVMLLNLNELYAQKKLEGRVVIEHNGRKEGLEGVRLMWLENTDAQYFTDSLGRFSIPKKGKQLVLSLIGFYTDTIKVEGNQPIEIQLVPLEGKEVVITERRKASYISTQNPFLEETLTEKEFTKAACCNLSESFETNPSVDANYNDALTGTKQIQMLGLSSIYSLITVENMPNVRGLSATHGLAFFPSAWVESIQITKGAGSVVNGFESMTGQINIELKKPSHCGSNASIENDSLNNFMNFYVNQMARTEINFTKKYEFSPVWNGMSLVHASIMPLKIDMNHDHFLDNPVGYQLSYMQRANYQRNKWNAMLSARALYDFKQSGQFLFNSNEHLHSAHYGILNRNQRLEASAKIGYIFSENKSLGNQFQISHHDMHFDYGTNHFKGQQYSFYYNGIYQSLIADEGHILKTGFSFLTDIYQKYWNHLNLSRNEITPGIFVEYTWKPRPVFTAIIGSRLDKHSQWGFWFTPRAHFRYEITENTVLRWSVGKGTRTPLVFTDHWSNFISSRRVIFMDTSSTWLGLKPEISWNYGISLQQKWKFFQHDASITIDFFRTDFVNQLIVDRDANSLLLKFYNLNGSSFSNSLQISLEIKPIKNLELRSAYKLYDVQQTIDGKLRAVPLISKHRGFLNGNYRFLKSFSWDFTFQYHGRKRVPDTFTSPKIFQLEPYSKPFGLLMTQVNYEWKRWEFYVGGENLTHFRQKNPIVNAQEPFQDYFDASMVWGPIYGAMGYFGLRVKW